jgi:hypothetical protein
MSPTPWQTELLALGWAVPRIWRTLSCNAYMPECMYEPPPFVLCGNLPRAVLRSFDIASRARRRSVARPLGPSAEPR